jgi:flavin reductase (DIM6/NTAB) family NADH-FMN oxidoreductase RutF
MPGVDAFEKIVAEIEYPMVVVTATDGVEHDGCLVGFSTQCSIDPQHYAVFLSVQNRTTKLAQRGEALAVHPLHEGDLAVAALFGGTTGDEVDKFTACRWEEGPHGLRLVDGLDWFVGRILDRFPAGDHLCFVLEVETASATRASEPQLSARRAREEIDAGHPA